MRPGGASTPPAMAQREVNPMSVPDSSTIPDGHKRCTRCGEVKPYAEMVRNSRKPDGYASRCKACHNAWNREIAARDPEATRAYGRAKAKRQYHADPETWRARHREWYAANHEHCIAYAAEYQRAHPERKRFHDRLYSRRHSADIVRRVAAWAARNPDRARAHRAASKAKRRGAGETRRIDRDAIWKRDGGRCHICGKRCDPGAWDLDHLVPLSRGGPHREDNVAVSHPTCNRRRHNSGPAQLRLTGV